MMRVSPAVSVVVCIYNVERYLRDCLDSIAGQSFTDFECILCDDDSTDASGLIASRFAESDDRFVYVHQQNRGPGPAGGRNGGIPYVSGERILFVDSDDILLPDAIATMYESAESTGSQLVIGGVDRFNSSGRWPSFLHQRVHEIPRLATTIEDYPEMVWDSTAWNKLISTQLWMDHIKFFDEGRLYEDLYPMIRLMCLANSVDILSDTVYLWRDRESKTSVTQEVASTRGLVDKVDQMLKLDDFLVSSGNRVAKQAQDHKLLTADVLWMLDDLDRGSHDYHEAFWDHVPQLVEAMDPTVRAQLPAALEAQYEAVCDGDRGGLAASRREAAGLGFSPHAVREIFSSDAARTSGGESLLTELFGRVTKVRIDGEDLVVEGFVALDRVRLRKNQGALQVWFESWETGRRVDLDVDLEFRPRLHLTRNGPQLHRYSGFTARVPAHQLIVDEVPVGNVMIGARLVAAAGEAGSDRLRLPPQFEWRYPRSAGPASIRCYRDHQGFASLKVTSPERAVDISVDRLHLEVRGDFGAANVCLFDPVLKRRWMAELDPASSALRVGLDALASGEYELQALRFSRVYEDAWVPIVGPSDTTSVYELGDRVLRLHRETANTFVEIAGNEAGLRPLTPTLRTTIDERLTELARTINQYTWI